MGQWRRPMRSQPSATPSPPASKSISRSFTTGKTVSHLSLNNRLPPYNLCHILTVLTVQSIIKKTPRKDYIDLVAISARFSPPRPKRESLWFPFFRVENLVSDRLFVSFFSLENESFFFFSLFSSFEIDSRITHNSGLDRSGKINFNRETRSVNVMINFSGGTSQRIEVVGNRTSWIPTRYASANPVLASPPLTFYGHCFLDFQE